MAPARLASGRLFTLRAWDGRPKKGGGQKRAACRSQGVRFLTALPAFKLLALTSRLRIEWTVNGVSGRRNRRTVVSFNRGIQFCMTTRSGKTAGGGG